MTKSTQNQNRCSAFTSDWDRLFTSIFKPDAWTQADVLTPRINVAETETEYEVSADLPGIKPADVKVEIFDGELSISGARRDQVNEGDDEHKKRFLRVERRVGEFRRAVSLPSAVQADKIEAQFDNGVLFVRLPKSAEQLPQRIEVKPSQN